MKQNQPSEVLNEEDLEIIMCKLSSAVCDAERLTENFNELKNRYIKAVRALDIANETNAMLKKEIGNLRCREAALMGQLRYNSEKFAEQELDIRFVN